MVCFLVQNRSMKIEDILSRNLSILMDSYPELSSQQRLSKKSGVGQTSVGRMRRAEGSATIDNVHAVARAFGIAAHDLLDPKLPLRLSTASQASELLIKIAEKVQEGSVDSHQLKIIEATLKIS